MNPHASASLVLLRCVPLACLATGCVGSVSPPAADSTGVTGGSAGAAGGRGGRAGDGGASGGGSGGSGGSVTPIPRTDAGSGGGAGSTALDAGAGRPSDAGATIDAGPVIGSWPCSTEPLCDDFEAQPLGQKPAGAWTVTMAGSASSGQVVRVDDKHAFSGKQSIFFGTSSGAPYAYISPKPFAKWPSQTMFGRMMLYFEDVPGGNPPAHAPIVRGTGDNGVAVHFGARNGPAGMTNVYALTFTPNQCDTNRVGSIALPKNRWFCYEWMWRRDTGEWALWTDGAVAPVMEFRATGGACWRVPTIDAMDFGWMQNHEATQKLSMWMDAVALSGSARLGCPALQGH